MCGDNEYDNDVFAEKKSNHYELTVITQLTSHNLFMDGSWCGVWFGDLFFLEQVMHFLRNMWMISV